MSTQRAVSVFYFRLSIFFFFITHAKQLPSLDQTEPRELLRAECVVLPQCAGSLGRL
jgi:hypothetical protein